MNKKMLSGLMLAPMVLLAAMTAHAQSAYFQAVTNLNPVGYWPMHEMAAAAAGDIETNYGSLGLLGTGYYPDWVAGGSAIQHQVPGALAGDNDTAVYFQPNGANTYTNAMYVPHTSPLSTLRPPFSVECWFNTTNNNGIANDVWSQEGLVGLNAGASGSGNGNVEGIRLYGSYSGFLVYTYFNSSSQNNLYKNIFPSGVVPAPSNTWNHVVVTCDAQTNISIYVNGSFQATVSVVGKYLPDSWTPFEVGSGRGNTRSVQGAVDEVAIYTNDLQASDIAAHYNSGIDSTDYGDYFTNVLANNPVIYLRMDGPAYIAPDPSTWPVLMNYGSVAINGVYTPGTMPGIVSGPANSGGVPFGGLSGNVAQLNGVSGFADAGYASAYDPTGATPFSVTAMFKGNPTDGRIQTIVGHSDNSWGIALNTTGHLQCQIGTDSASLINSVGVYNDGNWHQVVEVYTPNTNPALTGTNALYVDGALDSMTNGVTASGILPGSPLDLMIGSDPQYTNNPAGVGRQFAGQVCEVALFTNALTAAQVQQIYNAAGVTPFISTQPVSAAAAQNSAFTNTVVAGGSGPFFYQWYQQGLPRMGQTNASLILNPVQATDDGTYYVVVSNNYSSVTSAVVNLTVFGSPTIISQFPLTYTNVIMLFAGASPTFSVSANGTRPLYYQWITNGVAAGGATNASFTLANIQASFTDYCIVTNLYGSTTSIVWTASVIADPAAPYPQAVLAANPIGYWRLNEGPDDGAGNQGALCHDYVGGNDGFYTNVNLAQPGYSPTTDPTETSTLFGETGLSFYDSDVNGIQGIDFSAPTNTSVGFTVEAWVKGIGQATANTGIASKGYFNNEEFSLDTGAPGDAYRFEVRDANGTAYNANSTLIANDSRWHHLVGVCDEANSNVVLYIDGLEAGSTGIAPGSGIMSSNAAVPMIIGARPTSATSGATNQFYGNINDVAIYNYALSSSQVSTQYFGLGISPSLTQEPLANTNVNQGSTLTISTAATGTPPISYQWYDANTSLAVAGQTNATLVISNIFASDNYYLTVTNLYGSTNSTTVSVNVISGAPQIYADITPIYSKTYAGRSVIYSITAYGTAPLYYQWYENGVGISAATNSIYTATVSTGTNTYSCVVSNAYNGGRSVPSSIATLVGISASGLSLYSLTVLSNNPVAYWRLDEPDDGLNDGNAGVVAHDYAGGHDGFYTNVELGVPGYSSLDPDSAALFGTNTTTGTLISANSYVGEIDLSGNGVSNIDFSQPKGNNAEFSVEAWVNWQKLVGAVVSKGYDSAGGLQFVLDFADTSGTFRFQIRAPAGVTYTCNTTITLDGRWHHVVGVCDEANGNMWLYLDGVAITNTAVAPGTGLQAASQGTAGLGDNRISIGSHTTGMKATSFGEQTVGRIDEVALYNYALTANQIAADYNAGQAVVMPRILTITNVLDGQFELSWNFAGTLQSATNVIGPYNNVTGATSPYPVSTTNAQMFYRIKQQ